MYRQGLAAAVTSVLYIMQRCIQPSYNNNRAQLGANKVDDYTKRKLLFFFPTFQKENESETQKILAQLLLNHLLSNSFVLFYFFFTFIIANYDADVEIIFKKMCDFNNAHGIILQTAQRFNIHIIHIIYISFKEYQPILLCIQIYLKEKKLLS